MTDWRYEDGASVDDAGVEWRDVAVEGILNLANPLTNPLGVALYGEVRIGDDLIELESKLILQKNAEQWVFAWNGTIEAEWEGSDFDEDNGEFQQTLGASYQLSRSLLAGFELFHQIEYEDWSRWTDHAVFAGPNFSYRGEEWWVTITPLVQITDVGSEPDFHIRLIFGMDF